MDSSGSRTVEMKKAQDFWQNVQQRTGRSALMLVLALGLGTRALEMSGGELLQGPIRGGFSVAEADRETGARKYALTGVSATPLTGEDWEIQSPRLELYGVGGATNLVFMPSRCFFNRKTEIITSTDALRMWTGDGYLRMQGEGFMFNLKARRLWVSNRVEAVMSKRMFGKPGELAAGNAQPGTNGSAEILVKSDRLEYGDDRAEFLEHVRAEDAENRMECQKLTVDLTPGSREVRVLRVAGGVRLNNPELQVEAERADYQPADGRLELEGNPQWVFRGRPGRADRVILDRGHRSLGATGGVEMELPAGSFILPALPGAVVAEAHPETAEAVRVTADQMDVTSQPGETNRQSIVLRGNVRVEQKGDHLSCRELEVRIEGEEHAIDRVEARQEVVIEREMERVRCQQAEYDARDAAVELSGGVEWESSGRSGEAERVRLDLSENAYLAEGGVRMRFDQKGEFWNRLLVPEAGEVSRSETGDATRIGTEPIDIRCDRFEYQRGKAAGAVQSALYQGDVSVEQGEQLHLTCNLLRALIEPPTNRVQSIVAEEAVELRAADGPGYRLARGDRAVYTATERQIVLTGREGVEFFVIAPNGVSRGVGRQAIYRGTTDSLVLAGDPKITTPDGELAGREVRLDRRNGVLSAKGPWQIKLPLGGIELPELPNP